MKYDAVIFDLDGTLTDSAAGIVGGIRHALSGVGRALPDEALLRTFVGPPLSLSFMEILGMGEEEYARALALYREYYSVTGYLENAVFPGVRALLKAIRDAGTYVAIASNKPRESILVILEHFDLLRYFDSVQGPLPDEEPDKAELIARANPAGLRAVMVGDRALDIEAAHAVGIPSVAALWGYGTGEELHAAGATFFADSIDSLYALLGLGKPQPRGYFISFEGNDGSGKSTQAKLLAERLSQIGYDVLPTREPGGTPIGETIRGIVLDAGNDGIDPATEALLYAAARAQHVSQVIRPALDRGMLVVSDRYVDSSVAYQGAGRGLGTERVRAMNDFATGGLLPDVTLFIRLAPEEGIRRRTAKHLLDRLEKEGADFHARVAEAFDRMASGDRRFVTVESQPLKADTAQAVFEAVTRRLREDGMP
ncbi:MAG TPA: dTMP kinase [Candidatus Limnocylindria bacterium]|nr:dTMP kinase [Candidatus Limnocylindria bacterium]